MFIITLRLKTSYIYNIHIYNNNVFLFRSSSSGSKKTSSVSITNTLMFRSIILSNYWRILSYFNQFRRNNSFKIRKFVIPSIVKRNISYSSRLNYLYYFRVYRFFFLQKKEKIAWQRYIQRFRVWYNLYRYLYSVKDISCILNVQKKNLQIKQYSKNINYSQKLRNFTFLAKTDVRSSSVTLLGNSNSLSSFFKMRKMRLHLKNKLTFNNLFFETNFVHVLPWRSRKFWAIRAYSSLYTKRVFFKRFYTFRLERGFIRKNSKVGHTPKRVNFLSYSHERFHKFRLFYTTLGYRQFQQLFLRLKHFKKYAAAVIISILEFRAEFFLYRLNFAPSKYFAKQMIARGAFAANGHVFTNKNFRFSIGDTITVTDSSFNLIFDSILNRIRSIRGLSIKSSTKLTPSISLFFNNPGYIEMDYCLLNAIIFKKPKITDVFVPNYLELDPLNRNLAHIYNSYL